MKRKSKNEKVVKEKNSKVIVYSTPTCPYCNALKDFLKENKIKFENIDVSKNQKAAREIVKKSGQTGVPVTIINGKVIVGFDQAALEKAIGKGK